MKKVWLAAGYQVTAGFTVFGYYATEGLARDKCAQVIADNPSTKAHEKTAARLAARNMPASKWKPWVFMAVGEGHLGQSVKRALGGHMVAWWSAKSGDGMWGNHLSNIVVVACEFEGSAVDQLAEVARGD